MMQITEDTPPDMLAGAMDLTVHLPNAGQSPIKISVNRSTPMMDLLVQVTTAHRLQPSAHIIQAIGYSSHQSGDAIILPYKPNTPIGALDTKLIKIIPKSPSKYSINNNNNINNINNKLNNSTASNVLTSAGIGNRGTLTRTTDQLPFESTFRLQVHLPRNQLYVARVSQFVTLENIMKKVCTEKNLDEKKYEFRHPVNFHEVLDPKLTLSDYQITEVTVVKKGKAVSASDMATLQREEERRRQQARNGGGVFNLIFKRGKSGMGSGSVSSDTRSISPTRSDSSQSRSITPPAIQHTTPKIIENKHENEKEFSKPKPPLRKRRPAPKPPTTTTTVVNNNAENIEKSATTQITTVNECTEKIIEENNTTPLTICHSRNSSDSSGYHEASILSDTFNVQTLPRKNKALTSSTSSINYGGGTLPTHFEEKNKNNMTTMGNHSKSTSNLSLTGQKKKRAPPPPPIKSSVSVTNLSTPTSSVVVSAKAVESSPATTTAITNITDKPVPIPRRISIDSQDEVPSIPKPKPRKIFKIDDDNKSITDEIQNDNHFKKIPNSTEEKITQSKHSDTQRFTEENQTQSDIHIEEIQKSSTLMEEENLAPLNHHDGYKNINEEKQTENSKMEENKKSSISMEENLTPSNVHDVHKISEEIQSKNMKEAKYCCLNILDENLAPPKNALNSVIEENQTESNNVCQVQNSVRSVEENLIPLNYRDTHKTNNEINHDITQVIQKSPHPFEENLSPSFHDDDEDDSFDPNNIEEFVNKQLKKMENSKLLKNTDSLPTIDNCIEKTDKFSSLSLRSMDSEPNSIKKWNNYENLDGLSLASEDTNSIAWVIGGNFSDTESISSQQLSPAPCLSPTSMSSSVTSTLDKKPKEMSKVLNETTTKIERKEPTAVIAIHPVELPPQFTEPLSINTSSEPEETNSVEIKSDEFNSDDAEWQYQLPSPPTAFRDTSPTNFTEVTNYDTITLNGLPSPKLLDEKSTTDSSSCSQEQRSETTTIVTESEKILPEYAEIATPPQEFSDIKHFSVETLEQRKSQVLDKQLASLKLEPPVNNPKEKLRNELEEVLHNVPKIPKQSKVKQQEITTQTDISTLPNFKLTTYDQPKRVINIFEDDSVRSNVDTKMAEKKSPIVDVVDSAPIIKRSSGISERDMNIMNSLQNNNDFKKPIVVDIKKKSIEKPSKSIENLYERSSNGIQRADSFSISESNNGIAESLNPVKRSKSHVSLNKYKLFNGGSNTIDLNGVTSSSPPRKTSSQWDISDLQSLQVMRTILPKIQNSQPNSPEEEKPVEIIKETPKKVNVPEVIRKPYQYSPPAVNLGTWSERPKSQVSLKSDNDYKIGGINISTFEKRPSENDQASLESKTSTARFINHTTAVGFKRPEPISKTLPRPHSIAFDTYQDLSRVPIVRAVELKKTFRDNLENKSTDIRSQTLNRPSFHRSTESVNQELKLYPTEDEVSKSRDNFENNIELRSQTLGRNVKPVYRHSEPNSLENKGDTNRTEISNNVLRNINKFSVNEPSNTFNFSRSSNSFLLNRNSNLMPVVKGFRSLTPTVTTNGADLNNKQKPQTQPEKYTTNCIPVNMSRSDSEPKFTVTVNGVNQNFKNPIPPPPMPKVTAVTKKVTKITPQEDPRDQLLNAIKNFGKDSLKPVRY
ncbi:uncharacterized protein LOC123293967 isoform X2 [Chrysoperla carnea]|nr:uncharacterized protein LOC123293967 isoform X2 [Chrysoperla carnea]XP_044730917.1 uncharacterized protein LOC123293967 isoform X2 [Chrysoperla carnea]